MKTVVNKFSCRGCGKCIYMLPDIFEWNNFGKARSISEDVPLSQLASCRLTASLCPVNAIIVSDSVIDIRDFLRMNFHEAGMMAT